jgi:hypothetical protein
MLKKFETSGVKEFFTTARAGCKSIADGWRKFKTEFPQTARGLQATGLLLGAGFLILSGLVLPGAVALADIVLGTGCASLVFSTLVLGFGEAKRNKEIITQTKEGQTLSGPRGALNILNAAQLRVDRYLSKNFNSAAGDLSQDQQTQINLIIQEAAPARDLVKVLDAEGKEIAGEKYKFNRKVQTTVALNL